MVTGAPGSVLWLCLWLQIPWPSCLPKSFACQVGSLGSCLKLGLTLRGLGPSWPHWPQKTFAKNISTSRRLQPSWFHLSLILWQTVKIFYSINISQTNTILQLLWCEAWQDRKNGKKALNQCCSGVIGRKPLLRHLASNHASRINFLKTQDCKAVFSALFVWAMGPQSQLGEGVSQSSSFNKVIFALSLNWCPTKNFQIISGCILFLKK